MKVSQVLHVFLAGLCLACHAAPPLEPSSSTRRGAERVPVSHLKTLSLGLVHLLQGVEENAGRLGRQGERAAAELEGGVRSLEALREEGVRTGRTHRQVRKDLQVLSARGDRLERVVQDLQKGLGDLVAEQGVLEHRMDRTLQRARSLTEPVAAGGETLLNMSLIKVIVDKQARRLASLASEVVVQDRMINRRLQHIEHLEKQVSRIRGGKPPVRVEGRF